MSKEVLKRRFFLYHVWVAYVAKSSDFHLEDDSPSWTRAVIMPSEVEVRCRRMVFGERCLIVLYSHDAVLPNLIFAQWTWLEPSNESMASSQGLIRQADSVGSSFGSLLGVPKDLAASDSLCRLLNLWSFHQRHNRMYSSRRLTLFSMPMFAWSVYAWAWIVACLIHWLPSLVRDSNHRPY